MRALRRRRRWRQVDLAVASGVSQSTISRFERGHLDELALRIVRDILAALDARAELEVRWRGGQAERLVDERHAALGVHGTVVLRSYRWVVLPEVTFQRYGERGSIDLFAWRAAERAIEIARERLGWTPRVIGAVLVVEDTTTNRRRLEAVARSCGRVCRPTHEPSGPGSSSQWARCEECGSSPSRGPRRATVDPSGSTGCARRGVADGSDALTCDGRRRLCPQLASSRAGPACRPRRGPRYARHALATTHPSTRGGVLLTSTVRSALTLPGHYAGVVLDLDGLLVRSEDHWWRAKETIFARRGVAFETADHLAVLGTSDDVTARYFVERFGADPASVDDIRVEYLTIAGDLFGQGVEVNPGAVGLLANLRGRVPVGLASNTRRDLVATILASTPFGGAFDAIVTGDDGTPKPAPDLYLLACRLLGVDPGASVALEDSPTGVAAAKAAGMTCIGVPSHPDEPLDRADLVVGSLLDLL